jgi:hypothetical protein
MPTLSNRRFTGTLDQLAGVRLVEFVRIHPYSAPPAACRLCASQM